MSNRTSIGSGIEVTLEFSRHLGPRYIHGAVTLQFDSHLPYAFVSTAVWPTSANYETAIREAVEEVLLERLGDLSKTRVLLKRVGWNEVDSCESGFRSAARAATKAAFEV
jgi:hypothetical protein